MNRKASRAPLSLLDTFRDVMVRVFCVGGRGGFLAYLVRNVGASMALHVANKVLSIATGVVLARALGVGDYGIYVYAFALLELLKIPTGLGLPTLVLREVAVYRARQDWGRLRGLLLRANQAVLGMSLLVMLLGAGASLLLANQFENHEALETFWWALFLLPLFGLTALRSSCLAGLHRIVLARVPELVVRPALFLALIAAVLWFGGETLTPALAMGLQVVAVGGAFLLGSSLLMRILPSETKAATPTYDTRVWAAGSLPFLLGGGVQLINSQTDLIMLEWFGTTADVGIYRVAALCASLVAFAYVAACGTLAPSLAQLHAKGDMVRLQRILRRSSGAILLLSLPISAALVFSGGWLLSSVFGAEFATGAGALAILALGQLAYVGMALAALLLDMTGHQRYTARAAACSALLNVVLNALLIPSLGINGAALASVFSIITFGGVLVGAARLKLGVNTTAFGPATSGTKCPLLT